MGQDLNKRKIKGSKKSKKSWRKRTDIADVEHHLDESRKDERTGGDVENRDDETLFFIDKNQDAIKSAMSRTSVMEGSDYEDEEEYVPKSEKRTQRLKEEADKEKDLMEKARNSKIERIWGKKKVEHVANSYLEAAVKKPKVKPKSFTMGKSSIAPVEKPVSGISYNPDYYSHQDLLKQSHDVELEKIKKQEELNKKVKMVTGAEMKKKTKQWLKEMSEGLVPTEDNHWDDEEDINYAKVKNETKSLNRKTRKKRRKEAETKEMEEKTRMEKKEKMKIHEIGRIKSLKRKIQQDEDNLTKRKKLNADMRKRHQKVRTKRLSKHKYEDPAIVVQLSEELAGTLRQMKPEGNLIEERFKSLQRRNIIEARKPVVTHRKYKKRITVKRSYKTDTIKDFKPN